MIRWQNIQSSYRTLKQAEYMDLRVDNIVGARGTFLIKLGSLQSTMKQKHIIYLCFIVLLLIAENMIILDC